MARALCDDDLRSSSLSWAASPAWSSTPPFTRRALPRATCAPKRDAPAKAGAPPSTSLLSNNPAKGDTSTEMRTSSARTFDRLAKRPGAALPASPRRRTTLLVPSGDHIPPARAEPRCRGNAHDLAGCGTFELRWPRDADDQRSPPTLHVTELDLPKTAHGPPGIESLCEGERFDTWETDLPCHGCGCGRARPSATPAPRFTGRTPALHRTPCAGVEVVREGEQVVASPGNRASRR